MLERWKALPRSAQWLIGVLAAVVLTLLVAWALLVPATDWLARHDVGSGKAPALQMARDAARGRLLTLGAGLLAGGALLFTALNFRLLQQGQVTDRYTKAVEQLGSDKLDVRIGGIYALERIARDSEKDYPTVMAVLTAFIREHSHEQWPPPQRRANRRWTRPDIQAAVTVVVRRDAQHDIRTIDLYQADLRHATLRDADLRGATLRLSILRGTYLDNADLRNADLRNADLRLARLRGVKWDEHSKLDGAKWDPKPPVEVPAGWKLGHSGRLGRAGTDSTPKEATQRNTDPLRNSDASAYRR